MGTRSYIAQRPGGSFRATKTQEVLRASLGVAGFTFNDFLEWAGAEVSELVMPYLISIFGFRQSQNGFSVLSRVAYDSGGNQDLRTVAGNELAASSGPSGSEVQAVDGVVSLDEWFHGVAVFISSTDRRVWHDDVTAQDTGLLATGTAQNIHIGRDGATSPWLGILSSLSIWDLAGASDTEIGQLVRTLRSGLHPIEVEKRGLGTIYTLGGEKAFAALGTPEDSGPWSGMGALTAVDTHRGSRSVMMQTRLHSKRLGLSRWVVS